MKTKQQNEALKYFKEFARDWNRQANEFSGNEINIINQRNEYVYWVATEGDQTDFLLDVGCGSGELVSDIAKKGINAIGVDFAKEMIDIASENAKNNQVEKAMYTCCSIFDFPFESNKYDVISANGFIEYISYNELNEFLSLCFDALKPGGSLILSSRNRLFNIYSLNKFTEEEIFDNNLNQLLSEAIKITSIDDVKSLIGFHAAALQKEEKEHEKTGIQVATRYQYTPVQLITILSEKGFEPVELFPIHIHGIPPIFKTNHPDVHKNISSLLQTYARNNLSLIPLSSSFMIHVKK